MASAARYLFDRSFDAPPAGPPEDAPAVAIETFTRDDLERARADGVAQGHQEALAEMLAKNEHEQHVQAALRSIADAVSQFVAGRSELAAQAGRNAVLVAGAIARKVMPRFYVEHARSEVEAVVQDTLRRLSPELPLTLLVAPALHPYFARLPDESGRQLTVVADPAIAEGDCRIEWAGGGLMREHEALWREIETLIEEIAGPGRRATAGVEGEGT